MYSHLSRRCSIDNPSGPHAAPSGGIDDYLIGTLGIITANYRYLQVGQGTATGIVLSIWMQLYIIWY